MNAFRVPPSEPFAHLFTAIALASLLGSVLFAIVDVTAFGAQATLLEALLEVPKVAVMALMLGCVIWVLYAIPALALLLRLRVAGPASALLVALAPGALLAVGSPSLGALFTCYGLAAGVSFGLIAYRRSGA